MVRNRWRQELRKPRSEGGATIDPEMGYEVGEALRQAKDDGQRMEKRLQELGEEANNLEECLRDAESERDRLREELEMMRGALVLAWPFLEEDDGAYCNTPTYQAAISACRAALTPTQEKTDV